MDRNGQEWTEMDRNEAGMDMTRQEMDRNRQE